MWSTIKINTDNIHCWKIGKKEIYVKAANNKWYVHLQDSENTSEDIVSTNISHQLINSDWLVFAGNSNNEVSVLPAFPDRPIVLKPSESLKILPGYEITLFVQVPLYIQYYSGSNKPENFIFEVPSEGLSATWFGEPDNGTLAYSLPFVPTSCLDVTESKPHCIICPVKLVNASNTILDVQRVLLHGEFLNIYWNDRDLWANEVKIKFKGEAVISDVQYAEKASKYSDKARLLVMPRTIKSNNVISKSFYFIKSLTNI